ncbi:MULTISPECIES: glycosyltransferase [Pseudanabaena]|uniref:glycosyltransferase n=1 Tax=Pseudanabaena TaxID=1152 RepID=UPI0024797C02|nr:MULTISPECIES: glycosyltransferase [Pseudanabaena]MEA5487815.1 glycosyltransferase [Pseudanabaena sp. CCNP1317]WGS74447.1 glycosyltransferase [Pseudanabaena galeata CCNP1313]
MRRLYFLLPGTTDKFACGGLWAELKTLELVKKVCPAEVVTYRQREQGHLWLDDLLKGGDTFQALDDVIFVMSWGFDVAKLAPKLKRLNAIYHAHSAGYGFNLPASVPIITVSRNTLGYWGQRSPHSLIYYLPNEISDKFQNWQGDRDIDVLVQARKSSSYLMRQLIPSLQQKCRLEVIDYYVEDLEGLFNRAKVYLYDSAEYWAVQGVTEGFGLQPMEALACGCQVFSSVNHGLSDYLDPAFNCYKIAGYSQEFDMQRILRVIQTNQKLSLSPTLLDEYRAENIIKRLQVILTELNEFFDHKQLYQSNIPSLGYWQVMNLRSQRILAKIKKRLKF